VDAEIIPSLAEPGNAGGAIAKKEFANTQILKIAQNKLWTKNC